VARDAARDAPEHHTCPSSATTRFWLSRASDCFTACLVDLEDHVPNGSATAHTSPNDPCLTSCTTPRPLPAGVSARGQPIGRYGRAPTMPVLARRVVLSRAPLSFFVFRPSREAKSFEPIRDDDGLSCFLPLRGGTRLQRLLVCPGLAAGDDLPPVSSPDFSSCRPPTISCRRS